MTAKRDQVEALYPLSPSQTGMWLQSQTAGSSVLFVEQTALRLDGVLDGEALRRALQHVVDRHEALRSAVLSRGDAPVRAVLRRMPVTLDVARADGAGEDAALAALMERERGRGFAFNRPPLIRFAAMRCDGARTWLVLTFHHLILDGWSLGIVWEEAQAAYAAEVAGTTPVWPPVPPDRTYADWLASRSTSASEAFWRARLAGFTTPNVLAPPPAGAAVARELAHAMSPAAGGALAEAARAARVSPATVVEVLWAALVAGRTRTSDVVFAATVSGRPAELAGIERMVGCFINTAPIRVRFDGAPVLRAQLVAHQQQRTEQRDFEYCASGQIQSWSEVPAHRPLAQSLLVYQNAQTSAAPNHADVPANDGAVRAHGARTAYPLTLLFTPGPAPGLRVIYQPAAFSDADAQALAAELERLILAAPSVLDRPVRELCATVAYVSVTSGDPGAVTPYVAPRNRLEHELAGLWRELFARERVGVHDDFFALGGHSLLALQMTARMRGALGIDVPLHVLVAEPTIERIARRAGDTAAGDADPLIPIAAGGSEIPVFCIHPLGGHVLCYAALGARLGSAHPVWGLQAKGLRAGEVPAATWGEIVEYHWALLMRATKGRVDDVALVGYSYGGYVAMELAARARRLGATHLPVVLLDVPHPSVVPAAMRRPDAAGLLHALFTPALDLDLAELRRIPENALLREIYDRALRADVLPPGTPFEDLARALAVAQAHARLTPASPHYDVPALLLRAREEALRVSDLPDLGWAQATTELEVVWVDGRHETMLEVQHVAQLAAVIGAYCAASGARSAL